STQVRGSHDDSAFALVVVDDPHLRVEAGMRLSRVQAQLASGVHQGSKSAALGEAEVVAEDDSDGDSNRSQLRKLRAHNRCPRLHDIRDRCSDRYDRSVTE